MKKREERRGEDEKVEVIPHEADIGPLKPTDLAL
jgi:hypothetical protein